MDSRQYEFADITAIIGGRNVTGLRGIKYTEKVEREPLYAKGRYPHSIQSGNYSVDGEVTMTQSELELLIAAGGGSVLNIKTDILVSYGNPSNGDVMLNDRLVGCMFTESAKEMRQGDKSMEITLPFVALRLNHQIA
ncbi:MAG: hypothetical protein ACNA7V_06710 [Bacteroidales bacterium]